MATVRELVTKLTLGGDAGGKLAKFGLAVNGAKEALGLLTGAFNLAKKALFDFTAEIARMGDEIAKSARNIGITAEEMQELAFAAQLAGADMRDVQVAIQRMGKGLNDARRNGTGPFADSVEQLGLSMEEFQGLDPVETFTLLSQELSQLEDASTKAALAQDFFGRGGKRLIPLIDEGAAGIQKLREEFRELGGGFTNDGAKAAEEFVDSQLRLKVVIDSIRIAIGTELFPIIQSMIEQVQAWIQENRAFIKVKVADFLKGIITRGKELLPTVLSLIESFAKMAAAAIRVIEAMEKFSPGLGAAAIAAGALGLALGGIPGLFAAVGIAAFAAGQAIARFVLDLDGTVTQTEQSIARLSSQLATTRQEIAELEGRRNELLADTERERRETAKKLRERRAGFGEEFVTETQGRFGAEQQLTIEGFAIRRAIGQQEVRSVELAAQKARQQAAKQGLTAEQTQRRVAGARRRASAAARANRAQAAKSATETFRRTGSVQAAQRAAQRTQRGAIQEGTFGTRPRGGGGGGGRGRRRGAAGGTSDAELLDLVNQAAPGADLGGIGQGRSVPAAPAPIVTVTVNQVNVDMKVDAPVNVEGVPGTSAEEVAALVESNQRAILRDEYRAAVEQFLPVEAR